MKNKLVVLSLLSLLFTYGAMAQGIEMSMPVVPAPAANASVIIPINVKNFNNVGAISLTIYYSSDVVTFVSAENTNGSLSGGFKVNGFGSFIRLSWYASDGQTLANIGTGTLVNLKFTYKQNGGRIGFSSTPGECEIAGGTGNVLPVTYQNGYIYTGPAPTLTINPSSLSFDNVILNRTSGEKTFTVTGSNLLPLTEFITFTAPAGFQISFTSGSGFASSIKVANNGGSLAETRIYTRFTPMVVQNYNSNIVISGSGAEKNIAVSGTVAQTIVTMPWAAAPVENGSFSVPIRVTNFNYERIMLTITYDASAMTFNSISNAPVAFTVNNNATTGVLKLDWNSLTSLYIPDGYLGFLNFKYKTGAGSYAFSTSNCGIGDPTGHFYNNITYEGGSLLLPPVATNATNITSGNFTANWQGVNGAVNYYFDVSTNSNFSSYLEGYKWNYVNGLFYSVSNLNPGTTYYYRMRAYRNGVQSRSSNIIPVKTAPAAPDAQPATSITSSSFTANWYPGSGATSFYIDVSTDINFQSYVTGYPKSEYTIYSQVNNLTPNTTYYYRVRGYNGATGPNSETISVTTLLSAPTANDASNITSSSFQANWQAVSGASYYSLYVSTDPNFGTNINGYPKYTNKTYDIVLTLNPNTLYYYRVRAYKSGVPSAVSNVCTTLTAPSAPLPPPVLISPANGATGIPTSTTFSWGAVSGAGAYTLQISTSSSFSTLFLNDISGGTSKSVSGLAQGTTYYWRVRATTSSQTPITDWSSVWSFTTKPAQPQPPVLISPANGATGIPTSTTFSWGAVSGGQTYTLQISTNSSFSTIFQSNISSGTSMSVSGLAQGTTYYWRVIASTYSQTPITDWSSVWSFTTTTTYYTISGCAYCGSGAVINGFPNYTVTDANGNYSCAVPSGWSGTISPSKSPYIFNPSSYTFSNVMSNKSEVDFNSTLPSYTISGYVNSNGSPISYAIMTGFPNSPSTDANGYYSVTVNYGWSGTVVPIKTGYSFSPSSQTYNNVTSNLSNNYTGTPTQTFYICGHISLGGPGLSGVVMNGFPIYTVTNSYGSYICTVPYGWSGTVTPSKSGYIFNPTSATFTNVTYDHEEYGFSATYIGKTSAQHDHLIERPKKYALEQNVPNPFNPSTNIFYQLPDINTRFIVTLKVYDILGREVVSLADGTKESGYYMATFNATHLSSGIYFARLIASPEDGNEPFVKNIKMLLTK